MKTRGRKAKNCRTKTTRGGRKSASEGMIKPTTGRGRKKARWAKTEVICVDLVDSEDDQTDGKDAERDETRTKNVEKDLC